MHTDMHFLAHLAVLVYAQHVCQLDLLSVTTGDMTMILSCTALEGAAATRLSQLDIHYSAPALLALGHCCTTGSLPPCLTCITPLAKAC